MQKRFILAVDVGQEMLSALGQMQVGVQVDELGAVVFPGASVPVELEDEDVVREFAAHHAEVDRADVGGQGVGGVVAVQLGLFKRQ